MTVRGITLTTGQADVFQTMKDWKRPIPDHALVPLVQHVAGHRLSSSGVRTRRHELTRLGLVRETPNTVKMPSGRRARMFEVA
jgi:hypothetical protein